MLSSSDHAFCAAAEFCVLEVEESNLLAMDLPRAAKACEAAGISVLGQTSAKGILAGVCK